MTISAIAPWALAAEPEARLVPLFNGRDLTGWVLMAADENPFRVEDGLLLCRRNAKVGYPAWLRSERQYENFVLRLEFKMPHYNEGTILIHAPLHGRASNVGLAVKLCDDTAHGSKSHYCGSVINAFPASQPVTHAYNTWHRAQIRMDWPRFTVRINDTLVQDLDCTKHDALRYRRRHGYLGIQNSDGAVDYRNIRIRELPGSEGPWKPLLQQETLQGWRQQGKATWSVDEGVITACHHGYLVSEASYRDFELFGYVRLGRHANGGIFYRWLAPSPSEERGYEVQLYNMPDNCNPTGSIYAIARANVQPVRDGEWFPIQVFAKGPTTIVRVNGVTTARTDQLTRVHPGSLALQSHSHQTIEFKGFQIKPLNPPIRPK